MPEALNQDQSYLADFRDARTIYQNTGDRQPLRDFNEKYGEDPERDARLAEQIREILADTVRDTGGKVEISRRVMSSNTWDPAVFSEND